MIIGSEARLDTTRWLICFEEHNGLVWESITWHPQISMTSKENGKSAKIKVENKII